MLVIAVVSFIFIVLANLKVLGKMKSQSLDLVKTTELDFMMNRIILPIHLMTKFTKFEITNRMGCLIHKDPDACIHMCDTIHANTPGSTIDETWFCYSENSVPSSLYGQSKCDTLYPNITKLNSQQYLTCLIANELNTPFKRVCELLTFGDMGITLGCW